MYDKVLIQRVCDLTCSKEEVVRNQTTIKYDKDNPFRKYYSISTIKGALEKFMSKEWDDQTLAHWACIYCWILCGGFDYRNIKEDLNTFEKFCRDVIAWALDGLSFFNSWTEEMKDIPELIQLFENYDKIWQTRNDWKAIYAMIGPFAEENEEQYVLLVNDKTKEYIIIYSDHLKNGFEDEHFRFVSRDNYISLVEQLKNDGYTMLSCSEEHYYTEIEDL